MCQSVKEMVTKKKMDVVATTVAMNMFKVSKLVSDLVVFGFKWMWFNDEMIRLLVSLLLMVFLMN